MVRTLKIYSLSIFQVYNTLLLTIVTIVYVVVGLAAKVCPTLVTPWTVTPLPMGFPRQAHWSGLPFLSPGDLPHPRTEPASPALQVDSSLLRHQGFPHSSIGKESACIAGDLGLIPGLGRSPGEGNGNPLQYSSLENPIDREAW